MAADSEPMSSFVTYALVPFIFFLSLPALLVPHFTQCGAFTWFLPPSSQHSGALWFLHLQLVQNFGLSFHVHFCFANMAFSSFFVPSQCSVTIHLIMSLDVTLICVFVMNLSRSLCSQLY